MKAKTKIGAGVKSKIGRGVNKKKKKRTDKQKRILPIAKRGGFIPVLSILGAIGALAGGAAGIAKAVNDTKAASKQLIEMQRHNQAMEGRGLYLAPYNRKGRGISRKGKKRENEKKTSIKIPHGSTTNVQLERLAKLIKIPYFRRVFMRDALPQSVHFNESGIINLDCIDGPGTHWVAYVKRGRNSATFFDSFGNLQPPR